MVRLVMSIVQDSNLRIEGLQSSALANFANNAWCNIRDSNPVSLLGRQVCSPNTYEASL